MSALRGVLYALVVPWLAVVLRGGRNGALTWAVLAALGLLLVFVLRRRSPVWLRSLPVRAADVVCFNAVVALVAIELALRAWIAFGSPPAWLSSTPDTVHYRLAPSQAYFGTTPNSGGFYDEEWTPKAAPGVRRVAVVGDSYTVGMVPFADNYVTVADERLGPEIELLNLGIVHTAVPEYVQVLRSEALRLEPELVVLGFYIGNDIHEDWATGFFSSAGSKALHALRVLLLVSRSSEPYQQVFSGESMMREEPDGTRTELPLMTEEKHVDREWKHLDALFRDPPKHRTSRAWRDTERAIRAFVALCRAKGLPVVATIAPDEIQVVPALFERVTREHGEPTSAFDLEYPNRRLAALFAELGVPVLDFLAVLREAEARGPTYHLRAVHWNRHGNAAVAAALAPFLASQLEALGER
jgi:hypothetical protein